MARMIHCIKLNKEAAALDLPPYPGVLGKKIYETVSQEAWQMWIKHQTMLINENRLALADPKARQFLQAELEKYFFGEGSAVPSGYVAPKNN